MFYGAFLGSTHPDKVRTIIHFYRYDRPWPFPGDLEVAVSGRRRRRAFKVRTPSSDMYGPTRRELTVNSLEFCHTTSIFRRYEVDFDDASRRVQ